MTDRTTEGKSPAQMIEALRRHLVSCGHHADYIGYCDALAAHFAPEPGAQHELLARECDRYAAHLTSRNAMLDAADLFARCAIALRPSPTKLWCLHAIGPDDVYAAPSREMADAACVWYAERFKDHPEIRFEVIPWPHSAESHAASVPKWNTETMPQLPPTKRTQPVCTCGGFAAVRVHDTDCPLSPLNGGEK